MKSGHLHLATEILIAGVWIFHGLFSKVLNGVPRHRLIVERILGEDIGGVAVVVIGVMEILLGFWVLSGRWRRINATVQTLGLITMNALEIFLARDLLISAVGMVFLNTCFISLIWWWAIRGSQRSQPS